MAVIVNSQEIKVRVPAKRMIKAMVAEPVTVLPKIMSAFMKNIDVLHGNGVPGTILQTNFHDGAPAPSAKHRIDAIDIEKGMSKYTMIEGAWIGDKIESIVYEVKFEEVADGGCLIKVTNEYHTKGDAVLNEGDIIKEGIDHTKGFYTTVEQYLIANPDVCA